MSAPDDIDTAISAASANPNADTLSAAVRALDAREVFYRATVNATEDGQRVTTPLARLSDGSHALVVYTSKSHPELPSKFGGASWRHVLSMTAQLPQADWLIVSTESGAWLPISRRQVPVILNGLNAAAPGSSHHPVESVDEEPTLDEAISQAHGKPPDDWSRPLMERLGNRELYVRISPDRLEGGRPVLITSTIGEVGGLIQTYTSRIRKEFTYGGMTWEAIADMVKNAPAIPGVHLINDNDDWVVLDRKVIEATGGPVGELR